MPERPLHRRILSHIRSQCVGYVALLLVLSGGGYAFAATRTKTIHGCVVKKTGELLIKARCGHGQSRLVWNQQGPQGTPGTPAVSAWAVVTATGSVLSGQGISVTHVSAGTYQVTTTATACANKVNSPTVTVLDANPPNGQSAGAFPLGWVGGSGNQQFTVFTGIVASDVFTATDRAFDIHDSC
jgi:predicted metal-binding membrane protein